MRWITFCFLMSSMCFGQSATTLQPDPSAGTPKEVKASSLVIPAGNKVPLTLKQADLDQSPQKEGDAIYAIDGLSPSRRTTGS